MRAARIELASLAWKAGILAIIRRPRATVLYQILRCSIIISMIFGKFSGGQEKPFHSSAYAKMSGGEAMGTASSQSFSQRRRIERNRRTVGRYSDSYIAQRGGHLQDALRHRLESPEDDDTATDKPRILIPPRRFGGNETNISAPEQPSSSQKLRTSPRSSFREPPTRGYNPYQ